ncbi:Gfo/Idh/MocA family oxidoreductase [Anaerocolumna sp.]|uniref:Gfo/Idh/MocA family oxidoreductase n=1 Tax=Anaerocolumna sp. TaxID=2041569 RepID=UPI0028A740D2|nr:Gfo/Idh/MocA family oxidoreductase [Anaerocolumna sp.]
MVKKINVGIAGFGMSGQIFQAAFLHTNNHYNIEKVFERKSSKSKELYPYVNVVRTFEELLTEDIDLIVISTPNKFHYSMAKQALEAGKNVIVEKPLCIYPQEAEELIQIAKEKEVLLSVYQNRRWDGGFVTAKRLIEEGRLGEVVDYEAHFDRFVKGASAKKWKETGEVGVGVMYDLGVHLIDQAVCLFGMPGEVYADIRSQREETLGDDNFQVYLYYNKMKAVLSASQMVKEAGPHIAVHGTKGSYVKYGMDVQEEKLKAGELPVGNDWGKDREENWGILNTEADGVNYRERIETEIGNYHEFYNNIYGVLAGKEELAVKPEQVKDVLRIIRAAVESAEKGRRIKL